MRVAIWTTSSLEPDYEAVSKEIFSIAKKLNKSWIFAVSPHLTFKFSLTKKYLGFNPAFYPLLRILFPLLEYFFDVNLVYGDISPWVYYKTLTKRPIIHTITQSSNNPQLEFLLRCKKIIVQAASTQKQLLSLGISEESIELWYPGVDLDLFSPAEKKLVSGQKIMILFATAPRTKEEMEGRGCHLLIEAAGLDSSILYRFLYRPWRSEYTSLVATQKAIHQSGVNNIELSNIAEPEMNKIYTQFNLTVIPYTQESGGKECPNSALESLASGIPVLVSNKCPFSNFIHKHKCGIVFEPTPKSLLWATNQALNNIEELSLNSRQVAEKYLNFSTLAQRYKILLFNAQAPQ